MKNPTKEQMQVVIDNLKLIEEEANKESRFDIDKPMIKEPGETVCGTVMCVGGWYAMATLFKDGFSSVDVDAYISFKTGTHEIAKALGFSCTDDLEHWADTSPELWGNDLGSWMFYELMAYNGMDEDSMGVHNPITIIIDHFKGVQSRLPN